MNLKSSFLCFVFFCFGLFTYGQDARKILEEASAAYNNAGGVAAQFTLDVKDQKNKMTYSYDGNIEMEGDAFRIEIPEGITWFDGATQWVYVKGTEEVTITAPGEDEQASISPSALFNVYKTGYELKYNGIKTENNKSVLEIEMISSKKNPDFPKIIARLDKGTNLFSSVTFIDNSGLEHMVSIRNMKTGLDLPGKTFSFDEKQYPQAELIDLR